MYSRNDFIRQIIEANMELIDDPSKIAEKQAMMKSIQRTRLEEVLLQYKGQVITEELAEKIVLNL